MFVQGSQTFKRTLYFPPIVDMQIPRIPSNAIPIDNPKGLSTKEIDQWTYFIIWQKGKHSVVKGIGEKPCANISSGKNTPTWRDT